MKAISPGPEVRTADDRRFLPPEIPQGLVQQPFDDGMLLPEIVQLRPTGFLGLGLAGLFDGIGHACRIGAQGVSPVGVLYLPR